MTSTIEVFCSYARKDQLLLDELNIHLIPLKREGLISLWKDTDISPGAEWEQAINKHLNIARIILLLVSPSFIASEYCYSKEMKRSLERHEQGEAQVIPVILRPIDWKGAPFGRLHALPKNAKPVTSWRKRDEAFLDIAIGIRKVVEDITKQSLDAPSVAAIQMSKPKSQQPQSGVVIPVYSDFNAKGVDEAALAKLREELYRKSEADRRLLEADRLAPNLFEREKLVQEAVELYPDYKLSRHRQLGIEMSIAVLDGVDPYVPMRMRRPGYGYNFTKEQIERLTQSAFDFLLETVFNAATPDAEAWLYLACMYGYRQQFKMMLQAINKAMQADEGIEEEFREPKKLIALLHACGSDSSSLAKLGKKIGLVIPASKNTFCNFLKNYDLTEKHTFIEWLAIKRPGASGERGIFVIKITPPYAVNEGLVDASALRVGDGKVETIVQVDKQVTIEELFERLNALFFLISPNE